MIYKIIYGFFSVSPNIPIPKVTTNDGSIYTPDTVTVNTKTV